LIGLDTKKLCLTDTVGIFQLMESQVFVLNILGVYSVSSGNHLLIMERSVCS